MDSNGTVNTCLFLEWLPIPNSTAIKLTAILTTFIGSFSSLGAVIGNFLILAAFAKSERLQTPSNLLIGSLCMSDFLTGLIVIPFSAVRRLEEAYGGRPCIVRLVCAFFAFLCLVTSVVTVGEISIDRYYAILMPFRYQRQATNLRYVILISISWIMLALITSLPFLQVITAMTFFRLLFALMGITIVVFLVTYARISSIVRLHRLKIRPKRQNSMYSQESRTSERSLAIRESRKASTIAIVITVGLFSYLPLTVMFILRGTIGDTVELVTIADPWADLFLQVTSLINPIIYCLRSKEIRDPILRIVPACIRRTLLRIFRFG